MSSGINTVASAVRKRLASSHREDRKASEFIAASGLRSINEEQTQIGSYSDLTLTL